MERKIPEKKHIPNDEFIPNRKLMGVVLNCIYCIENVHFSNLVHLTDMIHCVFLLVFTQFK